MNTPIIAAIATAAPLVVALLCVYVLRKLDGGRHLSFWAIAHAALAAGIAVVGFVPASARDLLPWPLLAAATASTLIWSVLLVAGIRVLLGKPDRLGHALLIGIGLTIVVSIVQHLYPSLRQPSASAVTGAIVLYGGAMLIWQRHSVLYVGTGILLLYRGLQALYVATLLAERQQSLDLPLALSIFTNLLTGLGLIMIELDNARRREGQARETERDTRQFLETVLDSMPATMTYKDTNLRYRIVNRQMRALLRPYGEDVIGRTWSEIAGADVAAVVEDIDRQILKTGEPTHIEQGWTGPDGKPVVIWALKMPLRDSAGDIQGVITCGIDVTRLKETEIQLIEQREAAEAASRAKSVFLANMSHELRTPLNAIIGFAEMMMKGYLGQLAGQQQDYVTHIYQSGEHLLRLVSDLLDLSRLESGKLDLNIVDCDFDRLAEAALAMVEPQAQQAQVKLVFAPTKLTVRADERALTQILVNLLGNAVKFNRPDGKVEIKASMMHGILRMTVEDTGIGMSPAESRAAIQPFHRADVYRTRANSGAGLGLSICRSLVELHGGRLEIRSQPGQGTSVEVALPA
jgi:PAS domain S-box-containing protein